MKTEGINSSFGSITIFKSKRVSHNVVAQLAKNNPYSLSEPNQRAITNAIAELGRVPGEKNIKFLMDTAAKSTYSTNIVLKDKPKNNWKEMLLAAAASALALTTGAFLDAGDWLDKILDIGKTKRPNKQEKEILKLRKTLLDSVNLEQIEKETKGTIKDFERNLDYFIVSSETTLEHKKYVLERLNYFMSDEYKINPQLKDKKSIAVAEMINDMAINVPGNKVPNIKSVNQKNHGMCGAISIVRKKLAYEDKPNYVDSIISELDDTDRIMVYDRANLESGRRIPVPKVEVDFEAALAQGYRIIDASTMHWMQIADMNGSENVPQNKYHPFDRENFDVMADSFLNAKFEEGDIRAIQTYYQALIKAKDVVESYLAGSIKQKVRNDKIYREKEKNIKEKTLTKDKIVEYIAGILPEDKKTQARILATKMLNLEYKFSNKIPENNPFAYIPNEEDIVKKQKIKNLLIKETGLENIDEEILDRIVNLAFHYHQIKSSTGARGNSEYIIRKAQRLYEVGAALRYMADRELAMPDYMRELMIKRGTPDNETLLVEVIDILAEELESNSAHTEDIMNHVNECADEHIDTVEEMVKELRETKDELYEVLTKNLDTIYRQMGMGSRREALKMQINDDIIQIYDGDTDLLAVYAEHFNIEPNEETVVQYLEALSYGLEDNDEDRYTRIFNIHGNKSQIDCLLEAYKFIGDKIKAGDKEVVSRIIKANNIAENDQTEQQVANAMNMIGENINSVIQYINDLQKLVRITDADGGILYSADPREIFLQEKENFNLVPSYAELRKLQKHIDAIQKDMSADEFQSRQGKLTDSSLYEFSPMEMETLKMIENSINSMHRRILRELDSISHRIKIPLEELKRDIGVSSGEYWVVEGRSGVSSPQEVKILEYMTGRPHYVSYDIKDSIEKIKTNPYSAISSSSVYDDKFGFHAQYVADLAPVKVKTKDENGVEREEIKEVLFHDNTWGG